MKPISLYIHIPFCERRCPYCDFVSGVAEKYEEIVKYVDDLCSEMAAKSNFLRNHIVETIYMGGGTPSLLEPAEIWKIITTLNSCFNIADDYEFTIECNPNSISLEKVSCWRNWGINRISIGVQSFSKKTLKILGRLHTVEQAKASIILAANFFDNISIDLIYGVPNGPLVLPQQYLEMVKHVSAYCLTSDKYEKPDEEIVLAEQKTIENTLWGQFIDKYEISNYAIFDYDGEDFRCRHNLNYWRCGEWIGFGRGAESHFNEPWSIEDKIMLGLRTVEGISIELLNDKREEVDMLVKMGLLKTENGRVACTNRGFLLHNQILLKLI